MLEPGPEKDHTDLPFGLAASGGCVEQSGLLDSWGLGWSGN